MLRKWNNREGSLLCLASFTWHQGTRPRCGVYQRFVPSSCWVVSRVWKMYHDVFVHFPAHGGWGSFQIGVITIQLPVRIHIQVFEWTYVFISLRSGSRGGCVFKFMRNCQNVFQSGRTISCSTSCAWESWSFYILISPWYRQLLKK